MKILLTSLNTKYIHNNLAIQYLKYSAREDFVIDTMDFTINQNIDDIIFKIIRNQYNIIGFSTYIWNFEETLKICNKLKKINNDLIIILGGPEVSFNGKKILEKYNYIDYIISGEGEESFKELLNYLNNKNKDLPDGILQKNKNEISGNTNYQIIDNLNDINLIYDEKYIKDKKIIYYETSRGCPYNCEFCLSSSTKKVRYFNLDRCLKDIKKFLDFEVPLVKFIDRTFNYNKKHAISIIKFILNNDNGKTTFHLEIHPSLIDEDYLELFKKARINLFQFEVGVQSTNIETCKAIKRVGDFHQIKTVCKEIISYKNIHLHLDLITGLPFEGYNSLKKSFNDILSIRPDKLQLGFLKVLKGSPLWFKSENYGIIYDDNPPYEVIFTKWISYLEIQKIKLIEDLVDKFYNEKYFINTFEFLVGNYYNSDFDFFEDLSDYWYMNDYHLINHSRDSLYKILYQFSKFKKFEEIELINEILIHDYIITNQKLPYLLNPEVIENNLKHSVLKNEDLRSLFKSNMKDMSTKKTCKNIFIIKYKYDIISSKNIVASVNYILYDTINNLYFNVDYFLKEE